MLNVINEIISENNNIIYFSAKDCLQHIDSLIKNKNEKRNINNSTSKNSLVNNQSSKNKTKTKSEIIIIINENRKHFSYPNILIF